MSKKSNGWGIFWLGFFLVTILPKQIAKGDKKKEWKWRFIFLAIILSPFWIGFFLCIIDGKIP